MFDSLTAIGNRLAHSFITRKDTTYNPITDIPLAFNGFNNPSRYKIAYGGRGGGKSESIARLLLNKSMANSIKVLCVRSTQTSIKDSVHSLFARLIKEYNLQGFSVTRENISHSNGSLFIFKGLEGNQNNSSLKSLDQPNICWVEEAQYISAQAWDLLTPTIRANNSEIWATLNPLLDTSPIYQLAISGRADVLALKINYTDNPYCPQVLIDEAQACLQFNPDAYNHIWLGQLANRLSPLAHIRVENFSFVDQMTACVDPAFNGQDYTAIAYGYWEKGKSYLYVEQERINCAEKATAILAKLNSLRVNKIFIEETGNGGSLVLLFKRVMLDCGFKMLIKGYTTHRNKDEKIISAGSVFSAVNTLHPNSGALEALLNWHEASQHDDAADVWASWHLNTAPQHILQKR